MIVFCFGIWVGFCLGMGFMVMATIMGWNQRTTESTGIG